LPAPLDLLSAANAELLQSLAQGIRFDKRAEIFEEGSPGDCFYIIDNGVVRIELAGGARTPKSIR
jgi:hypothetical protein